MEPPTVKEIIEALQNLPPDYPVFLRAKYSGPIESYDDIPFHLNGISVMESETQGNGNNVTFLF